MKLFSDKYKLPTINNDEKYSVFKVSSIPNQATLSPKSNK